MPKLRIQILTKFRCVGYALWRTCKVFGWFHWCDLWPGSPLDMADAINTLGKAVERQHITDGGENQSQTFADPAATEDAQATVKIVQQKWGIAHIVSADFPITYFRPHMFAEAFYGRTHHTQYGSMCRYIALWFFFCATHFAPRLKDEGLLTWYDFRKKVWTMCFDALWVESGWCTTNTLMFSNTIGSTEYIWIVKE